MIVVYRCRDGVLEFLLLHRGHHGPEYEGDWAWTPPSGARYPGEALALSARRELEEETQLCLTPRSVTGGSVEWPVFIAEAPGQAHVHLSPEHDRFDWLALEEAAALITPHIVRESFLAVAGMLAECE
jgi:predicted NUDIX family NTP pyrophosphohydrolase